MKLHLLFKPMITDFDVNHPDYLDMIKNNQIKIIVINKQLNEELKELFGAHHKQDNLEDAFLDLTKVPQRLKLELTLEITKKTPILTLDSKFYIGSNGFLTYCFSTLLSGKDILEQAIKHYKKLKEIENQYMNTDIITDLITHSDNPEKKHSIVIKNAFNLFINTYLDINLFFSIVYNENFEYTFHANHIMHSNNKIIDEMHDILGLMRSVSDLDLKHLYFQDDDFIKGLNSINIKDIDEVDKKRKLKFITDKRMEILMKVLTPNISQMECIEYQLKEKEEKEEKSLYRIFDIKRVKDILEKEGKNRNANPLSKIEHTNGVAPFTLASLEMIPVLESLDNKYTNFKEVTRYLIEQVRLKSLTKQPLKIPPILLNGIPGVGKSSYLNAVAKILSIPYHYNSGVLITAAFVISGSDTTWRGAKGGLIAKILTESNASATALLFIDELDKVIDGGRNYGSVFDPLYNLLEPETSVKFKDEFYDTEFDASQLSFVFASNKSNLIPEPILNRCVQFHIGNPSFEDLPPVIYSIWSTIRDYQKITNDLISDQLSDDIIFKLQKMENPRTIRKAIEHALAKACTRHHSGLIHLELKDFEEVETTIKKPFGFIDQPEI